MLLFIRNPNTALYRETIYERVWGGEFEFGSKTVDLRRETKRINAAINGRGGGTERMIQGRALAERGYITSEILSLKFDC